LQNDPIGSIGSFPGVVSRTSRRRQVSAERRSKTVPSTELRHG
jgi:hypothetical protein